MNKILNFTPITQAVSVNTYRKPGTMTTDCIIDFARDVEDNRGVNMRIDDVELLIYALEDGSLLEGLSRSTVEDIHQQLLSI